MLIASPEERVVLWHEALHSPPERQPALLRLAAKEAQEAVSRHLDLYSDYDDLFVETFELLGQSGLFGRDQFRIVLEEADGVDGARSFVWVTSELLDESTETPHLEDALRESCAALAEQWRAILDEPAQGAVDTTEYWSVAEVADFFDVTPQAVYRWIDKDKIEWRQRPGGSYMIPAGQFTDQGQAEALNASTRRVERTPQAQLRRRTSSARPETREAGELVDSADPVASFSKRRRD